MRAEGHPGWFQNRARLLPVADDGGSNSRLVSVGDKAQSRSVEPGFMGRRRGTHRFHPRRYIGTPAREPPPNIRRWSPHKSSRGLGARS